MALRLIALALLLALTARSAAVSAQQGGPTATTVGDHDRVTVMQLSGVYDRQPPANRDAELEVRRAVAREYFRTHADDVDFFVVVTRFAFNLGADAEGSQVGGRY